MLLLLRYRILLLTFFTGGSERLSEGRQAEKMSRQVAADP
eukprot:COSAG01_NODE_42548_length_437_cov_0.488235_1_plen_39_part_10